MTKEFKLPERIREEVFSMIRKTMEKQNISQAEVARRIGAQRYNVNKVLQEKMPVSLEFLLKIAESLGLEAEIKLRLKK
jgi:transcriptional regulator with XRE-family HTH domain